MSMMNVFQVAGSALHAQSTRINMDVERSAFAENAVQYQASVTFINGLITGMQRAIQGQ